jgi:hypothetical protein
MVRWRGANVTPEQQNFSIINKPGWAKSRDALVEIARLCRQVGIPFLVARESGDDQPFFDEMKNLGIEAVSLQPAWEGVPRMKGRVSIIDPHPSSLAHQRFAEVLVDEIDRRGWLKQTFKGVNKPSQSTVHQIP